MKRSVDREYWESLKKRFYERMIRDRYIGYLDPGIEEVLEKIFRIRNAFPTSSCSGRIYVVDAVYPWMRRGSHVVFKKHAEITEEEMLSITKMPTINSLWLIVSGPIIHVNSFDSGTALKILRVAREAGFKHSGVLSKSRRGYLVEVISGVRLDLLIKRGDMLLINVNNISVFLETINNAFRAGRERLKRFSQALEKLVSEESLRST